MNSVLSSSIKSQNSAYKKHLPRQIHEAIRTNDDSDFNHESTVQ